MNHSIPSAAAHILDFVRATEVGTTARKGYDVIYGQAQGGLRKPITSMTLLEVQQGQSNRWGGRVGSSATGGYQFMYTTLGGLIEELKLDIQQRFTPDLQDRLAYLLLVRRKYPEWASGKIGDVAFARQLAQEWASFPVLVAGEGAHRKIARGQSFYTGDGLNKALVKPERIERMLDEARRLLTAGTTPPPPDVEPPTTPTEPKGNTMLGYTIAFVAGAVAGAVLMIWLASQGIL